MNQSLSDMEHPLSQFRYCPKCGSEHFKVHNEKSKQCADCGFIYYFNPSSATVALILNEKNELLVCRRAKDPAKGTLDLPGGFIDMNETGEEGVRREVKEETGLDVKDAEGGYMFTYKRENPGEGDNYFVDVYRFTLDIDDSDVNFQEAEIDGYMFASIDEIKVFAQEGIFLHYDSIKKVFE